MTPEKATAPRKLLASFSMQITSGRTGYTLRKLFQLIILLVCLTFVTLPAFAVGPTITVCDHSGSLQTDRPISFAYPFKQGDFAHCPQVKVGGSTLGSSDWQATPHTRWASDSSVKWSNIAFNATIAANSCITVTFTDNASCNTTGYLTQSQMHAFNSSTWGAEMDFTFNGVTKSANADTMLQDNDPDAHVKPVNSSGTPQTAWGNEELNSYWTIGPAETCVLLRDGTSASKWDFGGKWDGTTMNLNSGAAYTGNSVYASIHPWYQACFYPKNSSVMVTMIYDNDWIGRWQDQLTDLTYKTGNPLSAVLTNVGARQVTDGVSTLQSNVVTSATASFVSTDVGMPITISPDANMQTTICGVTNSTTIRLCETANGGGTGQTLSIGLIHEGERYPKTFWTGTGAPGGILIDYDLAYLSSTGVMPPIDTSVTSSPASANMGPNGCSLGDYSCASGSTQTHAANGACEATGSPCRFSDTGDRGGTAGELQGASGNNEGAPLQFPDAYYLHNMGTSTVTANGLAAQAWYMLTGERAGANDSGLAASILGGAGFWRNTGNYPYHLRASAVVNGYYSAAWAGANAQPGVTTFGSATGAAIGKPESRYNRTSGDFVGTLGIIGNAGGDTVGSLGGWVIGCDHIHTANFVPALLTTSYYHVEEQQFMASMCAFGVNPAQGPDNGNGFFEFFPGTLDGPRAAAWSLQEIYRAALVSPDGTAEQLNYDSIIKSNAIVQNGFMGISSSSINPTDTTCSGYSAATANRYCWGRHTVAYNLTPALQTPFQGFCAGQIGGNNQVASGSILSATSVSTHTTLTSFVPATAGETITITGANGNWPGLNGNWVVSNVVGTAFDVPYNSTAVVGALTGHVTWFNQGFMQLTTITKGNPTTFTSPTLFAQGNDYTGTVYGFTGTNWTNLNNVYLVHKSTSTTGTIPLNSSGYTGSPGGTGYYNTLWYHLENVAGADEQWMLNWWRIVLGEIGYSGIPYYADAYDQTNQRLTQEAQDVTYNPYLTGAYAVPVKSDTSGSLCDGGSSASPYYATLADIKAQYVDVMQNQNSYDAGTNFLIFSQCGDQTYSLAARAAAQFISGVTATCTQGTCLGSSAKATLESITPYFNNTPTGSSGCGSYDGQIRFALQPPAGTLAADTCAITAPTAAQSISGTFNFTGTNSPGQGSANGMAFTVDGSSIGSQSGSSPYTQSYNTTLLTNGAHTAACTCSDDGGGSGTCPGIAFTVSNAIAAGSIRTRNTISTPGTIQK